MRLNVVDRLILLSILPREGDVITLRVLRDLKSGLSFSEEELAALQFQNTEQGTIWRREADKEIEIGLGQKANQLICDAFRELNDKKGLKLEFLPTYEKFIKED